MKSLENSLALSTSGFSISELDLPISRLFKIAAKTYIFGPVSQQAEFES